MAWATSKRQKPAQWQSTRRRILARDEGICRLRYTNVCIINATEVDHVINLANGGSNEDENLQAACVPCHRRKSSLEGHASKPTQRRPKEAHPGLRS